MRREPPPRPRHVEVRGVDWIAHYFLGLWLLAPSVVFLLMGAPLSSSRERTVAEIASVTLPLAILVLSWRRRLLRFRRLETTRTAAENYAAVLSLAERRGWQIARNAKATRIEALAGPEYFGRSARRIAVRFHGSDVYVNSIRNPELPLRGGPAVVLGTSEDVDDVAAALGIPHQDPPA